MAVTSPEYQRLLKKLRSLQSTGSRPMVERREELDAAAGYFSVPDDFDRKTVDVEGIPGEWLTPPNADATGVILYLHGGGYCIGSIRSHCHMVAKIARAAGKRALMIDYGLAPERPFPQGLDDAARAMQWLNGNGVEAGQVVVAGDSAGGGLTLCLLLKLRDEGEALPAAAAVLSPWTDLTNSGDTFKSLAEEDVLLDAKHTDSIVKIYTTSHDVTHPHISPLFADLSGLPPLFVQVGTAEILLDDSRRFAEAARKQGVEVSLDVWEDMFHVWQFYADWIPEGQEAVEKIGAFIRTHLG